MKSGENLRFPKYVTMSQPELKPDAIVRLRAVEPTFSKIVTPIFPNAGLGQVPPPPIDTLLRNSKRYKGSV